jgi:predicted nuclease of predicted toxin-antitoxin system
MTLLLDVHLSPFITHWIKETFQVKCISFHHLNWQRLPDEIAFSKAKEMNAVVLTKDEDFTVLLSKYGAPPKIIWLTCGNTSKKRLKEILLIHLKEAILLLDTNDLVEIK